MIFDSNGNREQDQENRGFRRQTRQRSLDALYSNHFWQCHHFQLDIQLADHHNNLVARPYLTKITDLYSDCIMGIHLSFEAPNSKVVALALRHAILPKHYGEEYALHYQWETFGVPEYIVTDKSKHFQTRYLQHIAQKLAVQWVISYCNRAIAMEEISILEINTELLCNLPQCCGSYRQERQNTGANKGYLTIQELYLLLVNYIVNNYNQKVENLTQNQTKIQLWKTGLIASPRIVDEQEFNI
ncbi:hypothetical protein [Calothrix sp. NIES-2098]|uniref:hypothetical protein n=1 Tax=Calothrix sp. NIES-2098 TaxID=1954171 RepID=UPI000B5EFACB|nr:integrase, catalytic region [Calothrix sp. NIES-2098]